MKPHLQPDIFAGVVADDLRRLEHHMDDQIAMTGALIQTMAQRRHSGLSAAFGQRGAEKLVSALAATVEARGQVVMAHARLAQDATREGLRWQTTVGPLEPSPEDPGEVAKPTGVLPAEDAAA